MFLFKCIYIILISFSFAHTFGDWFGISWACLIAFDISVGILCRGEMIEDVHAVLGFVVHRDLVLGDALLAVAGDDVRA